MAVLGLFCLAEPVETPALFHVKLFWPDAFAILHPI